MEMPLPRVELEMDMMSAGMSATAHSRLERLEVGETALRSGHSLVLGGVKPPGAMPMVERSALFGRLSAFLPALKSANDATHAKIAAEGPSSVDVEAVGEHETHVAMNIAIAAMEGGDTDDEEDEEDDDEDSSSCSESGAAAAGAGVPVERDAAPKAVVASASSASGAAGLADPSADNGSEAEGDDPLAAAMFAYADRLHARRQQRPLRLSGPASAPAVTAHGRHRKAARGRGRVVLVEEAPVSAAAAASVGMPEAGAGCPDSHMGST